MKTSDFSFNLPPHLIAQQPPPKRGSSRLMVLPRDREEILESRVDRLVDYVDSGTVLVLNDTRVRKARLYSGGCEFLLLEEDRPGLWKALVSKAKRQRPGKRFCFPGGVQGIIEPSENPEGPIKYVRFQPPIDDHYLEIHGHVPLPPYIKRQDNPQDEQRYQTIYARVQGSAAAPTAGLHLTSEILAALQHKGVSITTLTLHVGLGTFAPIRSRQVEDHVMHEESYTIPEQSAHRINQVRRRGGKVMAVGTTVVRALEAAWSEQGIRPGVGKTGIFIYPGYRFRVVSQLLTNFHTPQSTLLALVSALAGRSRILSAYQEAIRREYRFFSYGDAMLIL